jgi:hypothetical protein
MRYKCGNALPHRLQGLEAIGRPRCMNADDFRVGVATIRRVTPFASSWANAAMANLRVGAKK